MDLKSATILIPPSIRNISCSHPRYTASYFANTGAIDFIQAFFIMMLTIAIVVANLMVIIVINCRRYSSFIHPQVNIFKCNCLFLANLLFFFLLLLAKIFNNFISIERFSNWFIDYTFWNNTCFSTLLALWRDILSNTGNFYN